MSTVKILNKEGRWVKASIQPFHYPDDLSLWLDWEYRKYDEDKSCEWDKMAKEASVKPEYYECYKLTIKDRAGKQRMLGLAFLDKSGRLIGGKNYIILDWLVVSPQNRKPHIEFKYVGSELLKFVIARSKQLGYKGVYLESLPDAEDFYRYHGLIEKGKSKDGWTQFIYELI